MHWPCPLPLQSPGHHSSSWQVSLQRLWCTIFNPMKLFQQFWKLSPRTGVQLKLSWIVLVCISIPSIIVAPWCIGTGCCNSEWIALDSGGAQKGLRSKHRCQGLIWWDTETTGCRPWRTSCFCVYFHFGIVESTLDSIMHSRLLAEQIKTIPL